MKWRRRAFLVTGIAAVLLTIMPLIAGPAISTPLYTYRMEQVCDKMNFCKCLVF